MPYSESRYPENEREGEIGFWMGYPYWGKGYMPEACKRVIQYAFEELHLEKIWCAHRFDNHNSKRVQEKCGFELHHEEQYVPKGRSEEVHMIVNCLYNPNMK